MVAPHLRNPRQCGIFPVYNGQGLCAWKVEVIRGGAQLGGSSALPSVVARNRPGAWPSPTATPWY
ncbi:hypothetical protein QNM99_09060 [Pseudomonas sp. PCH446]